MDVSAVVAQALRELAAESPVRLRISGNCMAPLLESGAMIQVVRQSFYWPGDPVVVYAVDGRLLGHRLLGFYPRSRRLKWLTQADNARWPDAAVPMDRIIGRICGGQCAPALVRVPLVHRAKAMLRFFLFILIRLGTLYR
ncbi:MAG: S24 family peptidase [Candidatus Contendobacter sp.]|nr:S24 family peptidase [Candidatus Contendobacter sp.]